MKYKINDIFTLDEEYTERANFCNENGYCIEEIEQKDGVRQFTIKEPAKPSIEELANRVRSQRNALLAKTDYLVMPDYPIGEAELNEVKAYRQGLRDITKQKDFPNDVTYPEKPSFLKQLNKLSRYVNYYA